MADGRARYGTPAERLEKKIDRVASGCWEFTGTVTEWGYGHIWLNGRNVKAHRLSYELHVGPIPDGCQLDHLCRNRRCVNPDHLEPVSAQENVRRSDCPPGQNARKTHCPQGHPYSGDNLLVAHGFRMCKTCRRARDKARRAA